MIYQMQQLVRRLNPGQTAFVKLSADGLPTSDVPVPKPPAFNIESWVTGRPTELPSPTATDVTKTDFKVELPTTKLVGLGSLESVSGAGQQALQTMSGVTGMHHGRILSLAKTLFPVHRINDYQIRAAADIAKYLDKAYEAREKIQSLLEMAERDPKWRDYAMKQQKQIMDELRNAAADIDARYPDAVARLKVLQAQLGSKPATPEEIAKVGLPARLKWEQTWWLPSQQTLDVLKYAVPAGGLLWLTRKHPRLRRLGLAAAAIYGLTQLGRSMYEQAKPTAGLYQL